jgi:glycosyltransferase involved in cell wall biosynthesis
MSGVTVSVIVTCYNLGEFLNEAVDSVLTQSFQDFELIVVDDGSTEPETKRLLTNYTKPRTRVLRTENRGLSAARNLGIAHSTGQYLTMLDADDCFEPSLLERSVATLEAHPELAFVSHWFRAFGDETWEWRPTTCTFPELLDRNTINGAAVVRRDAALAVGGYDEHMRGGCEDWDFWISLVERGFRGAILPEFLFRYRRRPESMSRQMMVGENHACLYRSLARKHEAVFADHIHALLLRREKDLAQMRRETHDLLTGRAWLQSELSWWVDETTCRQSEVDAEAAMEADREAHDAEHEDRVNERAARNELEIHRLQKLVDTQTADLSFRQEQLTQAIARAYELDARAHRAEEQLDTLRRSTSWRLTAPLRFFAGLLRALVGQ